MLESTFLVNNIFVEKFEGDASKATAILFLHGYPANIGSKNRDIAKAVCEAFSIPTFLLHYSGLGKSLGSFQFSKSLDDVENIISYLSDLGFSKIHLVGHSWGGFLSIKLIEKLSKNSKITLFSPYLFFPEGHEFKLLVKSIYENTKEFLLPMTEEDAFDDLCKMHILFDDLTEYLKEKKVNLTIIQALSDDETPVEYSRSLKNKLSNQINYFEIDTDHSFTKNRNELIQLIIKSLDE